MSNSGYSASEELSSSEASSNVSPAQKVKVQGETPVDVDISKFLSIPYHLKNLKSLKTRIRF